MHILRTLVFSILLWPWVYSSGQISTSTNLVFGLNSYSYMNDGDNVFGSGDFKNYHSTLAITPSIGAEVIFEDVNIGVRGSFYTAPITSPFPFTDYDLFDVKRSGAVDIEYRWTKFRAGLIYCTRDFRRKAEQSGVRSRNIQRGIGLKLSTIVQGFEIELRKEMVWVADNKFNPWVGGTLLSPSDAWNIRLSYPLSVYSSLDSSGNYSFNNHFDNSGGLNFQFGTGITGNPNYEFTFETGRSNLVFSLGLEYFIESVNTSILFRRSQSFRLSVTNGVGREYIQNNYLGLSYWIQVSDRRSIKLDVLYNWSFNRFTQILINEEFARSNPGSELPEQLGQYSNRSIGFAGRYPISDFADVYAQFDYYYQSDGLSELGFAPNSLTVGLWLYLKPKN